MAAVDVLALGILTIAAARGLLIGMIREAFSLVALGGAIIAVRLFTDPLAAWLRTEAGVGWGDFTLRVGSGVLLVISVVGAVVIVGKIVKRGVRAAGLGWADRLGGGLLGTAEGLLVVGLILAGAAAAVGRDHISLVDSRALAFIDEARGVTSGGELGGVDVAAPPLP
ncbi:MAG: CvpA family protein [Deltaproteobacteria bacterium]|nr:CvpA family protein [Deltaproteobacteria bacterium]